MSSKAIYDLTEESRGPLANRRIWASVHTLKELGENPKEDFEPWSRLIQHEQRYTKPHHRKKQGIIRDALASGGEDKWVERMSWCGFPSETGAMFCRVRTCPICQYRRNLMWVARAYKALPGMVEQYPTAQYGLLTLTIGNCQVEDLRKTVRQMRQGFGRMMKLKPLESEIMGFMASVEVTRRFDRTAHPHLHVLLMAKTSLMGRKYIRHSRWAEMWRQSLRVEYTPVIHCKWFDRKKDPKQALKQLTGTVKYLTKEADNCTVDFDWFSQMAQQMHKVRGVSNGGLIRKYFSLQERRPMQL